MSSPTAHSEHRARNEPTGAPARADAERRELSLRRRGRQIVGVLARRAAIVGWHAVLSRLRRQEGERAHPLAVQVRLALEELGPTFIKLGQLLSARSDFVPASLQHELAALRDHAPAIPHSTMMDEMHRSLGRRADDVFAAFEQAPVACASIGQVHRATLKDGRRVAVKIRRPCVSAEIEIDVALLRMLARTATRLSSRVRAYRPVDSLDEFATLVRAETDYKSEADNIEALRRTFASDKLVKVPQVVAADTGDSLLIMEWIDGIPLNNGEALDAAGTDRAAVGRSVVHAYSTMIFQADRFHADPHPGNLIALSDGRLGLIDFGEVGSITPETRAALMALLLGVVGRDSDAVREAVLAISRTTRPVDRTELGAELASLLHPVTNSSLQDIKIGELLRSLLHVLRSHGLVLPADLAVLLKTVIVCEATATELDPNLEMRSLLGDFGSVEPSGLAQTDLNPPPRATSSSPMRTNDVQVS
jgi:ubiquinone biosynthesis protein